MLFVEGMCFLVEFGIYIFGVVGVWIEDCGVVIKEGFKLFIYMLKELKVLDF